MPVWAVVKDFLSVNQEESKPKAAPNSIKLTVNEKEGALPGTRVPSVGMCFYTPVRDPATDQTRGLYRNPDISCLEVRDRQSVRAAFNRSVLSLLAPYFDEGTVRESIR